MKGMKQFCVGMLICVYFFAVSAKNVEAGPDIFSNFFVKYSAILEMFGCPVSAADVGLVRQAESGDFNIVPGAFGVLGRFAHAWSCYGNVPKSGSDPISILENTRDIVTVQYNKDSTVAKLSANSHDEVVSELI